MSYKQEEPVKYCLECRTHFHAPPELHEQVYHANGEWTWVPGTFRDAEDSQFEF
jgi:hypothetical protein